MIGALSLSEVDDYVGHATRLLTAMHRGGPQLINITTDIDQ